MTAARQRRLAAVWFADIVGYTALASKNEDAALRTVDAFQRVARKIVEANRGQLVKFMGDGALAAFETAGAAVRAAMRLREAYESAAREAALPEELRIGVHLGEIVTAEDGDVYGDGVNVASRLQAAAEPGEILASEDVWRQLRRREGFALEPAGEKHLKGIADPMPAYRVTEVARRPIREFEPLPEPAPAGAPTPSHRRRMLSFLGIGALVALVAVGASTWFLGREGGEIAPAEASVAVLPFENLSGEAENEYFSDGITDDILTALSKVGGLKVISRTSTLQYKGTTKPIGEIAGELDVATILEGTVRRAGDQVRITAQLIDARTDEHLWAETYDRELTDVFAIQSEIAAEIADRLHVALSQREQSSIRAGETSSPEAYDLVLQARNRIQDPDVPLSESVSNALAAIRLLRRAIELDPEYARAHALLGGAYSILVVEDNRSWADSALATSRRAIELEPDLAAGHVALGWALYAQGSRGDALRSFRRAIELDPNSTRARDGAAYQLEDLGRYDEALEVLLPAVKRDPGDVDRYADVGDLYHLLGLSEWAEAWAAEVVRRQPDNGRIHALRAEWAIQRGDMKAAAAEVAEGLSLAPGTMEVLRAATTSALIRGQYEEARRYVEAVSRERGFEYTWIITPGYLAWKTGDRERADSLFREGTRRSEEMIARVPEVVESYLDMARVASIRGDLDAAVAWMERAYEQGDRRVGFDRVTPQFENVRRDPRFERLMERMEADVAEMRERAPKERP